MITTINKLKELKDSSKKEKLPVQEIQGKLLSLLLDGCDSLVVEQAAKKFDNDLELVIYTLNLENQLDAAINILDDAIAFMESNELMENKISGQENS